MNTIDFMVLTQYDGKIIGPFAWILGKVMEFLYNAFSSIGIENVGLCIITFTIVIRFCLLPLTVKQQKFSKMSAVMNPELNKIREKYKGKNDSETAMRMNEETKAVYAKYGVSPSGSCLQLLIQMPILFGLYRVIWSIPAYVPKVYDIYQGAAKLLVDSGLIEVSSKTASLLSEEGTAVETSITNINYTIDALSNGHIKWQAAIEALNSAGIDSSIVSEAMNRAQDINGFFGINLGQTPMELMGLALLIPVLAGVFQWLSVRVSMSNNDSLKGNQGGAADATASSMKMINNLMPIFSVVMCFMLQCGIGVYWITGSVFQLLSQLCINAHFKKVGIDEMVKKNLERVNKKREKKGLPPQKITDNASVSTKSIGQQPGSNHAKNAAVTNKKNAAASYKNKEKTNGGDSTGMKTKGKAGGIAEKANMVSAYNEKSRK